MKPAFKPISELKVQLYADGADREAMVALARQPHIKGLTTNPTLMRKAGVEDYSTFARDILSEIKDKGISFEVFSDDLSEMEKQATIIASWAPNVYVKIPITNTKGESTYDLVARLSRSGIKVNVTAILTLAQVEHIIGAFAPNTPGIVSVFAGRIADTGVDPMPIMRAAKAVMARKPHVELLWASTRELLNIFQAEEAGADIVTVTHDILKKLEKVGYDHEQLSLETVKMFFDDGKSAGYTLTSAVGNSYIDTYLSEVKQIAETIDRAAIERLAQTISDVRLKGGRLFILGVGGSAANASHAVNDFRKIVKIETYAPTDNVGELTARTNDDGWDSVFARWLEGSNLNQKDAVFVLSVGGGNAEKNVSANIVEALKYTKNVGAKVLGIVSRDGGYTAQVADACVIVPVVNPDSVTPHAESWQAVVWHAIVFHPTLRKIEGKWESVQKK